MRLVRVRLAVGGVLALAALAGLVMAVALSPVDVRPLTIALVSMIAAMGLSQVLRPATASVPVDAAPVREPTRPAPPARYVVPLALPPPPLLVGRRDEMNQILDILHESGWGPKIVLIHGAPGIGKTALAIKVAHQVAGSFADGALFASLAGSRTGDERTEAVLREFVEALEPRGTPIPKGIDALRERFGELTAAERRRVLVVLDDAPDSAAVLPLLPAGDEAAVLVTSRRRLTFEEPHRVIEVKPLGDEEATSLLRAIVGEKRINQERGATREIVRGTEGVPLALQLVAGSLVRRRDWALDATLAATLSDEGSAGALDISYALLPEVERRALLMLGLLADQTFAPWMLAALLSTDEKTAWRVCDRLMHARLLEHVSDDATGVTAFRVLDHVWEYAGRRLRADLDEAEMHAAVRRLQDAQHRRGRDLLPRAILRDRVYPGLEEGLPWRAQSNARGALARAREDRAAPGAADAEGLALAALAEVAAELAAEDAREMADQALATKSPPAKPRALRCLGKLDRRDRNLDEAQDHLTEALAAARAIHDTAEQARVLRELAIVYGAAGRYVDGLAATGAALRLADPASVSHRRLRPGILWARALVLLHAAERGDPARLAEAELTLIDAEQLAADGGQRLWTGWIGWLRARVACALGQHERGRALASRAILEFTRMRHRYGKARCRLVIGRSYLEQGRAEEALPMLEEALGTFQTCADQRMFGLTALALADALRMLGRLDDARHRVGIAEAVFAGLRNAEGRRRVEEARRILDGSAAGSLILEAWSEA